ncbi:MAG: DUF397 domain-containing protein [Streptosporangiales bacterium]
MDKRRIDLTGAIWRKSRFCDNQNCVEVAHVDGRYAVRDSKNPDQDPLVFSRAEWDAFRNGVRAGEFG